MKVLPALLLNVVVVTAGVVVYDQVRAPVTEGCAPSDLPATDPDLAARLAALEGAKPVELRTDGATARIFERLEALERAREAPADRGRFDSPAEPLAATEPGRTLPAGWEPTEDELERYRKLRAAARSTDKAEKQRARVDKLLAKLDIRLSSAQRTKLAEAQRSFASRFTEIWSEAKSEAAAQGEHVDWDRVIAVTGAIVQGEFHERIASFLPRADADAIAAALHPARK